MASEEKGPIDWLRRLGSGLKNTRGAFKAGVAAEKAAQVRTAKRVAAAEKAKATREANKAAKVKAAEVAAAKPKRGRPKKSVAPAPTPGVKDLKEVKVSAPKTKGKKLTKKELAAKEAAYNKRAKRLAIGSGILAGGLGIGLALKGPKKTYKAISDPQLQKQIKAYDDSLKKAKGYKYGGTTTKKKK
jgi:hypothetical protein